MKNQTTKFNKSKLVARVMLVVFLLTSVLAIVSSCALFIGDVDGVTHTKSFNNHLEFSDFIQEYNSQSRYDISSFISFDFDNNELIDKYYEFRTRAPYKADHLYNDNTTNTNVELFFYFDDQTSNNEGNEIEYKIKCNYAKFEKTFFYTDNFEIKILDKDEMFGQYLINDRDYQDERLTIDNREKKKYDYVYSLALLINDEREASIKISSTQQFSEQQINAIIQMLLDSLVVINAEDFFIWRDMK